MKQEIASRVIAAFGGINATARAVDASPSTVHAWKKAGVPRWRWPQIEAAAKRLDVQIPAPEPAR